MNSYSELLAYMIYSKFFNIKLLYISIVFVFPLQFTACNSDEQSKKPNVILIVADDLGYNELGSYGQKIIRTPNLDRLAKEGMRFTDFYCGSPVCAPSRCVLLTGKHSGHAYVRDNYELGGYTDETEGGQLPLQPGTATLGTLHKEAGYRTGIIGKWGLGGPGSTGIPNRQGFDYFYGYLCQKQAHNYYPTHLWENEKWDTLSNAFFMAHQKMNVDPDDPASYEKYIARDYSPDKMLEKAVQFIRENQDTSFFLYLPFIVPHLALQVPDDEPSLEGYKNSMDDRPYDGSRGYLPNPNPRATYAAMITRMDRDIGSIVSLLEELGLDQNTLIVFTSDNGPTYGGVGGSDTEFFESNKPFRGLKGSVYEGGIRVPLIVSWKGLVKPGSVSQHVAAFQDIYPTLAEIIDHPAGKKSDGISFEPELKGKEQKKHPYLYWEFPAYGGQVALRSGNWKALRRNLNKDPNAPYELYNLKTDPAEEKNVAQKHPEVIRKTDSLIRIAHVPSDTFPFPALDRMVRSVDTSLITRNNHPD
jgi:arylsulfatase A-like enzyme